MHRCMRIVLKKRENCSSTISFPGKTQQAWQSRKLSNVSAEGSVGTTQDGDTGVESSQGAQEVSKQQPGGIG